MEVFNDIRRQVGLVDLLDIILVAAVIYAILSWLRGSIPESASRRIFVAAPVAAVVYVLVRVFDLYLLETVIRVLFIVLLIVAVVVFQSDIRRTFDRVVTAKYGRRRGPSGAASVIDTIVEVAAKMAEMRMGAIIGIKGREPLDSHVHGGIKLGGLVTQPLLLSIFHPETPGHDGAVIIDRDRVTRFAAHLPLASNVPEVSRFGGTRHAAALGLAEESDALVVVVSEERGTIAMAHHGVLQPDIGVSELKANLKSFWSENYERNEMVRLAWWRRPHLQTAGVAATLAMLFWLLVVYSPNTVIRSLAVPIEIRNLPEGWSLEGDLPSEAEIVLSGSEQVFRRLNQSELAISIDASEPDGGSQEIVLGEGNLDLPAGISLNRVAPQILEMNLRRLIPVRVVVTVRTTGSLPDGLRLSSLEVEPDSVTVMVPDDLPTRIRDVQTQEVDLGDIEEDEELRRQIVLPDDARLRSGTPSEVIVHVDVTTAESTS